jgi:type IV pilus assembly protein PilN
MIAQKKAKVFSNFAFKGIIGGVSLLYVVLFGLSFWNIKTYNDKLVGYEDIIQTHELRVLENKKIQKDIAKIVRSLDISKNIRSNKSISFRVLAQIASAVPKRVKFNSIQYDGNSQIIIEGGAFSDQDILKLISNLNGKKLISQASLATMTLPDGNEQGKQTMKGFKVVCILENV